MVVVVVVVVVAPAIAHCCSPFFPVFILQVPVSICTRAAEVDASHGNSRF